MRGESGDMSDGMAVDQVAEEQELQLLERIAHIRSQRRKPITQVQAVQMFEKFPTGALSRSSAKSIPTIAVLCVPTLQMKNELEDLARCLPRGRPDSKGAGRRVAVNFRPACVVTAARLQNRCIRSGTRNLAFEPIPAPPPMPAPRRP